MRIITLVAGVVLASGTLLSSRADVNPAAIFGNSMVLQRDQPVPVWGKAAPGEVVTVEFAGQKVTTKADAAGKWKIELKALPANATAQTMTIIGVGKPVVFHDVLVGEVWLCSGQSNMGLEVRKSINAAAEMAAANYPAIRGFVVTATSSTNQGYVIAPTIERRHYALTPQDTCLGTWNVCTPGNVPNWSGIGYFYARDLYQQLHVPIGIIMASYGATAIEAWISLNGLKEIPSYRERAESFEDVAKAYIADTNSLPQALAAEKAKVAQKSKIWFAQLDAEEPGLKDKWMAPGLDTSNWKTINLPVSHEDNPLGAHPSCVWFRKDVTIPAEWVGKELELQLGLVDGVDETYVNGVRVGRTWFDVDHYWNVPRVYPVPAAAVTSTNVSLALRVLKLAYPMGFFGPATNMILTAKDATSSVSITGEWRMAKSHDLDAGRQPLPAALLGHQPGNYYGHPTVQYNGQIYPLIPYAIRGAIWYQGEANAPFYVDYRTLMTGLITSWRKEWGQGDFPFGIIQLADYQAQQTKAVERISGYHLIREAQALAMKLPNTFMATVVGVGEGADIHPKNKQEVSRRLALAALGTVYGQKDRRYYGPIYKSMDIEGNKIRLHFDFAKGLHSQGDPPVGFAIAGANRKFYFAKAKIAGETVVVWNDKVPQPVAVRYAYASNPVCNVYNGENLPVFQFCTDGWDNTQLVNPDDDQIIIPTGWVPK